MAKRSIFILSKNWLAMSLPGKEISKQKTETVPADLETARRMRDIYSSDAEKFRLFTQMLRMNIMYKKAKITHK